MPNAISVLQEYYPAWEGTKALILLVCHPHEAIPAATLERCLNGVLSPTEAKSALFRPAPIRMTDEKTLKAVRNRLNHLIDVDASSRSIINKPQDEASTSKPQDEASTREITALTAYLKETTLPTGKIKCFGDDDTKAYRRLWAAINRLLKKAEAEGHREAVAIVKASLKQGKMFRWGGGD